MSSDFEFPLQCSACKFSFDNASLLLTHLRRLNEEEFHKNSDFVCQFCLMSSRGCNNFINHLMIHGPTNKVPLVETEPLSPKPLSRFKVSFESSLDRDSKSFKCSQCPAVFSRTSNLKQHLITHNRQDASTFHCSVCQKSFFSRSALKIHFRIHNNYAPFKCEFVGCAENFRTKKLMKTHIKRVHFEISATNKRDYSPTSAQRLIQRLAELSGKTMNEEPPLKKSVNSAFSTFKLKNSVPQRRHLGRASLDITQYTSYYYNANCMPVQSSNNNAIPRRFGSANFLVPVFGYRNNQ